MSQPRPSILDQLRAGRGTVAPAGHIGDLQAIRRYKDSVLRDLQWLLNSRATPERPGEEFTELRASSYDYGLPDFSGLRITSTTDRDVLAQTIREAIERHEPRLSDVVVELPEDFSSVKLKLSFKILAKLNMDPEPERVTFDTDLELTRGSYEVKGG